MLKRKLLRVVSFGVALWAAALPSGAQETGATPAAPAEGHDTLKVSVEEVRIPVAAYDEAGRFDPTLEAADLLVREDGVAQQVRGVFRVPASVVLLLDTGGELNPAKDVRLTREVAVALVSALRREDRVSVLQVNHRVELLQDWTTEQSQVLKTLRAGLLPGRRSLLAEGVLAAVGQLRKTPQGNRHLVLVSDGLDSPGGRVELAEAVKELTEANVTIHVISYTSLGRRKRAAPAPTRPREGTAVPDEVVLSLPRTRRPGDAPGMRDIMEAKGGVTLDLERLFRRGKNPKEELEQRERDFGALTEETGGVLLLPATAEEMASRAAEVAREVDSQYVVTYKPLRPLAAAPPGEYRRLDVSSRRVGLRVRSRRGYVAKAAG